ncbi:MAG: xanthine dehydrogenase family protein, partial [Candidatus Eisenbacteria bacterium]|nr:xanthine dehydrogenase family protein [Candidatus Eisenbacteria bacterium]
MGKTVHIGDSPVRPDGMDKVSGRALYVDDLKKTGMLHGATLRSTHAHARVKHLRFHPAKAPKGAVVVSAKDIPGVNGIQLIDDKWPALASGTVQHIGEPIALVAAATRHEAQQALQAFEVEYEPLEPVLEWADAEKHDAFDVLNLSCGDADAELAKAEHVLEGTYHTGHQEHIYIECQGMIAWWEDDGTVVVEGSMQCPYYVVKSLMHALDLPQEKVRVIAAVVGGGFGGKEDFPSMIAVHAALLARKAKRPVKIIYDRHEDVIGTTKRHPSLVRHRTAYDESGRLTAMDIEVLLDGGAYRTLSPVVLSRGVLHATGPYRCPNVNIRGRVLKTNTAQNAAFRGFGAPQVMYAVERQMDAIARRVGVDPLTIRERNMLVPGDTLPTGQEMTEAESAQLCLHTVVSATNFKQRWEELERERETRQDDGKPWRGIGLSLYFHGAGFTGRGEHRMKSPVTMRLLEDGRMEVLTAQTDIGQGPVVTLPLIAAAAAGIALEDIHMPSPDTSMVPDSGPTVASRTTMVVGGTIARASVMLRDKVLEWFAEGHEHSVYDYAVLEGEVHGPKGNAGPFRDIARRCFAATGSQELTIENEPPEWQEFDDKTYKGVAYATYGWGADVVEVEVDPDSYEIRPVNTVVACEIGKAIHRSIVQGQLEGGTLQ